MNRRISKDGFALLSLFYKIDRLHSLDIRYSVFDIRYSFFYTRMRLRKAEVALSIKLDAFQASGGADT
jgi:hypothetical protein